MNRKQRRASKGSAPATPPASVGALFEEAARRYQAGQLAEAEALYRRVLAVQPAHADSLHRLGLLQYQAGRLEPAAELLRRAIRSDGAAGAYHSHLALILSDLGRGDEAIAAAVQAVTLGPARPDFHQNLAVVTGRAERWADAAGHYRRAIALEPALADAHQGLADMLLEMGEADAAVDAYRAALALIPDFAEAHTGLGAALLELGRPDEALAQHERALAIAPDFTAARSNLGSALWRLGRLEEARRVFQDVIAISPQDYRGHSNLAGVLNALGDVEAAADSLRRALQIAPARPELLSNLALSLLAGGESAEALRAAIAALMAGETAVTRQAFLQCVRTLRADAGGAAARPWLLRALKEAWGRPEDLAAFSISLIRAGPAMAAAIEKANAAWPSAASNVDQHLAIAAAEPLLAALLPLTPIVDLGLERFLTGLRRRLLDLCEAGLWTEIDPVLDLAAGLAGQAFVNEYVYALDDAEADRAERLRGELATAFALGAQVAPAALVVAAAYAPLHMLADARRLLERDWPPSVGALLRQQVIEPEEETALRRAISALTPIEDATSRAVRAQYEDNPYPRWVYPDALGAPQTLAAFLSQRFPLAATALSEEGDGPDILIAGCGTGRNAIETTRLLKGARTLAVDLSLASLAHAARKSRELGMDQIEYAQADLLRLQDLGRRFDLIESTGVVHHLADPLEGWRGLLSLLRPGGVMKVGLYSRLARRNLPDMGQWLGGRTASAKVVREARQHLAARGDPQAQAAIGATDFFSVSACRDLLFHVQEHRFSLGEIDGFLKAEGLELLGFDLPEAVLAAYRRRFPADPAAIDLAGWAAFEADHPDTFVGMYQFWLQKR